MIHGHEDLFVGTIGVLLGLFLIGCAITNWPWYYTMRSSRWLQQLAGRQGARCIHALLGIALVTLGVAIALGYRWTLVGSS